MKNNKLIGMDFVVEVIKTVLLTGQLADEKPVSLLIIASPESGKTTAAKIANISITSDKHERESAVSLTDVTGAGLLKVMKENPHTSHVLLNDLAVLTGHKNHVVNYLFSIINAMTEEGVSRTADPSGIQPYGKEGLKGIIACITPMLVRDQRFIWNKIGMTSRMLPFHYDHGLGIELKVREYHADLASHSHDDSDAETLKIPSEKPKVHVKRKYRKQILELASDLAKKLSREGKNWKNPSYKEHGYRRVIQFMSLAKAHSLLSHPEDISDEPRVHKDDVKFLRKLSKFASYKRAEELEERSSSSDDEE